MQLTNNKHTGASHLSRTLEDLDLKAVFTVAGTQTVPVLDALRSTSLQTVNAVSELSAALMANGYFRASGHTGVILTIPGPGFMCALTGIVEALQDSAALLFISIVPKPLPDKRFQLQNIEQRKATQEEVYHH